MPKTSWKRHEANNARQTHENKIRTRYLLQTYYSLFPEFFFHLEPLIPLSSSLFSFFLASYMHTFFLLPVLDRHTPKKREGVSETLVLQQILFFLKYMYLFFSPNS